MPKLTNTRAQRAAQLRKRLEIGPSINFIGLRLPSGHTIDHADAAAIESEIRRRFQSWSETWLIPDAVSLIRELQADD
jgi:hypothetical protein